MHPDDDRAAPQPDPFTDPRTLADRQFFAMVRHLGADDPRFVRRCAAPAAGLPSRSDLMIITAVLAALLLGVVPLAFGVHSHTTLLLVLGTLGCLVAPLVLPWAVGRTITRRRPLWV